MTEADYLGYLARMAGFVAPLEEALAACPGLEAHVPDLRERLKARALQEDLLALGATPATLPRCQLLPPVATPAAALGALYVLEGSTLGAQQIRRHLQAHLPAAVARAGRYLGSYGARQGAMWSAFLARLEAGAAALDDHAGLARGAKDTFVTLEAWLRSAHA